MTTNRDIILTHYKRLLDYSEKHFPACFPRTHDVIDIVVALETYFVPISPDYRKPIKLALKWYNITMDDNTFEKHYNHIYKDLDFLVNFIKEKY
jgi:hypothetical protein